MSLSNKKRVSWPFSLSGILEDWREKRQKTSIPRSQPLSYTSKPAKTKASTSQSIKDKVFLVAIFAMAAGFALVGHPLIDGAYRVYKLYPLMEEAKTHYAEDDFAALYSKTKEAHGHLVKLSGDTASLSKFDFVPVVGPRLVSAHYTVRGTEKMVRIGLPLLRDLGKSDGRVDYISQQKKADLIRGVSANAEELALASAMLKRGELSVAPERIKSVITSMQHIAYLAPDLPQILGVDQPARYLVAFANNLEIRPGGGFVGSYALVTVQNGEVLSIDVQDSYNLPHARNVSLGPPSHPMAQRYLGIRGTPFRDSNWSSDYPTSAQALQEAYIREGGAYGHEIAGVITVTTEILQRLIASTGPVTVSGVNFDKDNAIMELQKQVEIDFWDKGIPVNRRKDIVGELAQALYGRIEEAGIAQNANFINTVVGLANTQHAAFNFKNERLQNLVVSKGWGGEIAPTKGDYFMAVDANLVGYKSEPLIDKTYTYKISQQGSKYVATVDILYKHRGTQLTPLVHNYRTYSRILVPEGSRLVSATGGQTPVEVTTESGRTSFGTLLVVPISQQRVLSFTYEIPARYIDPSNYSLLVQKQLGSYPANLQIDVDFDTVKQRITGKLQKTAVYSLD